MKLHALLLLIAFCPIACTTGATPRSAIPERPPDRIPSQKKIDEAIRYSQEGLPFNVDIDPFGAIFDGPVRGGELQHLKEKFLTPLAKSPFVKQITKVRIETIAGEWQFWRCYVYLDGFAENPISLTHYGSFYDGNDNQDPDAYAHARQYTLESINKIAHKIGWSSQ